MRSFNPKEMNLFDALMKGGWSKDPNVLIHVMKLSIYFVTIGSLPQRIH
jgi:hypothetical protein